MNASRTDSDRCAARARGLTMIELLIVVVVIGVLVGITLPAVQASREAARRMQCTSQMKQVGLALNAYMQLHGVLPSIVMESDRGRGGGFVYSPLVQILPHLEQTPLFHGINFFADSLNPYALRANQTAMVTRLNTVLCPSDSLQTPSGYGRTNYRFSMGPTACTVPRRGSPGSDAGAFTAFKQWSPSHFTDGLSFTIAASERLQGDWTKGAFRNNGDYFQADILGSLPEPPAMRDANAAIEACLSLPANSVVESRGGESWFLSGLHFTTYNHVATPNSFLQTCLYTSFTEGIEIRAHLKDGVMAASSSHPAGVNTLRMDGSVSFQRNGISRSVWRALSTRNGAETFSADEW